MASTQEVLNTILKNSGGAYGTFGGLDLTGLTAHDWQDENGVKMPYYTNAKGEAVNAPHTFTANPYQLSVAGLDQAVDPAWNDAAKIKAIESGALGPEIAQYWKNANNPAGWRNDSGEGSTFDQTPSMYNQQGRWLAEILASPNANYAQQAISQFNADPHAQRMHLGGGAIDAITKMGLGAITGGLGAEALGLLGSAAGTATSSGISQLVQGLMGPAAETAPYAFDGLPEALTSGMSAGDAATLADMTAGPAASTSSWLSRLPPNTLSSAGIGALNAVRTGSLTRGLLAGLGAYGTSGLFDSAVSKGWDGIIDKPLDFIKDNRHLLALAATPFLVSGAPNRTPAASASGGSGGSGIPAEWYQAPFNPGTKNPRFGEKGQAYFTNRGFEYAAGGGIPRLLNGPGDGMSDSIHGNINGEQPARLADGEFVVPADVVSHLGNGSTKAGAKQLYTMMDRIRAARTGKRTQAPAIKPGRMLPA